MAQFEKLFIQIKEKYLQFITKYSTIGMSKKQTFYLALRLAPKLWAQFKEKKKYLGGVNTWQRKENKK